MNRWHRDRFISGLRLLAMLPFEPVFLKQEICAELDLDDRTFRRLVDTINASFGVEAIKHMYLPDGSGVSYYRCKTNSKKFEVVLGLVPAK